MAEREPIGVVGVGWVGLVTASCFAELGHEVHAIDINAEKVDALSRGEVTIHEPGLPELLENNRERLHFTTQIGEVLDASRLLFCCVDTPPTYSGDADLSRVQAVVAEMPAGGEHALVMKSTVPSGTGRTIMRDHPDLAYVSCPEFLKEGTAVKDFMHPDRVVVGADEGVGVGRRRRRLRLRAARRRARPHRPRQRRDDQAGLERLPRDQDQLHQRDRQRLGGGRRRRHRGCPRDGPRRADRVELPARRASATAGPASRRT